MANDEFYTPAKTIIDELKYYGYDGFFKGKTIYLPCDYDATLPYIKKEIRTVKTIEGFLEFEDKITIYKVVPELFTEEEKNNGPRNCQFIAYLTEHKDDFGIKDIYISGYDALTGKGLRFQDAPFDAFDIIITNPPFSQLDEWIAKIIEFKRKGGQFIFLAPLSILTNTFAFKYFKNLDFWCGYTEPSKYENYNGEVINDYLPSVWITNFEVKKHKQKRVLSKSWRDHSEDFLPYWNFKGINVNSINEIPYDYKGFIGVPSTFLKDIHLDQFEIVGFGVGVDFVQSLEGWVDKRNWTRSMINEYYAGPKLTGGANAGNVLFTSLDIEHPYKQAFARMVIKNKELDTKRENYDFCDVEKFIKNQLLIKKPEEIWNDKLFKSRGNQTVKKGKGH